MKVWLTNKALTKGIEVFEGRVKFRGNDAVMYGKEGIVNFCNKAFCHRSKAKALRHAEALKNKEIVRLRKRIVKLYCMGFLVRQADSRPVS